MAVSMNVPVMTHMPKILHAPPTTQAQEARSTPGTAFGSRNVTVGASLLPLAIRLATARRSTKQLCHRSSVVSLRDGAGDRSQVEGLLKQADLLKQEALELEEEQRKKIFKCFDLDSSGDIDLQELQLGWKKIKECDLDPDVARRLLAAHDDNRNGVLEYEEFCTRKLEGTLRRLEKEDAAKAAAEAEAQRKLHEQQEAEQRLREYETTLPGDADTGFFTRFFSVAAYILPLLDLLPFGAVVGLMVPAFLPFFVILQVADNLADAIPFGKLIWFFSLQWLANKEEQPSLLRFNLSQALQIDIQLALVGLVRSFLEWAIADEAVGNNIWVLISILASAIFLPLIGYSVAKSLNGVAPRGLPFVSRPAEELMGVVKPKVSLEVDEKDKK